MGQFRFNCDEEEKARWQRAANMDGGRSLASWIRARLNTAAEQEIFEKQKDQKPNKRPGS